MNTLQARCRAKFYAMAAEDRHMADRGRPNLSGRPAHVVARMVDKDRITGKPVQTIVARHDGGYSILPVADLWSHLFARVQAPFARRMVTR